MPGEMAKQVAPQITGNADESEICDPARKPPQQIVGGDQRCEQAESNPDAGAVVVGEDVDEMLDAVLGADRADDGAENCGEDDGMGDWPLSHVTKDKGEGAAGVITQIGHASSISIYEI